ncbi:hypothetical protein [Streptomyces longispororuber]|uniref:hypothetical protein n=1 Tax=Streptomyces longispororuber TaxID=68230 RepID=UPI00210DA66D|nr:hypothetical protein [Streptomyces longispororuber]MCQ4212585.1 hypothetical protein [Streptomyces longispororuber]
MAIELPDDLIELQRSADDEGRKMEHLDDGEREKQREVWFEAAATAQAAVTAYAEEHDLNRFDVEKQLRQVTRHPQAPQE